MRRAAAELDVRIVGIDRPAIGLSTPHQYGSVLDFAVDFDTVLDRLGLDKVTVIGMSGGGPYALATGRALPERVAAVGVLGGVAPTRGADAIDGGLMGLFARIAPLLPLLRVPASAVLSTFVRLARPIGPQALGLYARVSSESDRRVLHTPEFKLMFLDDLLGNSRRGVRAPMFDVVLFTRHWGFTLDEVEVPVEWWHGDADPIVPLSHAHHSVGRLPKAELTVLHGESHLGGMAQAEHMLAWLLGWLVPGPAPAPLPNAATGGG
ncbi:MAG TPA: alpha/beta hydrolase [Acidimicrobiales bacterium]|nr:alpha/beta hydrolase [Acidimicrobiales bacterium]